MAHQLTTTEKDTIAYDRFGAGPVLIFITGAGPDRATDPNTVQTAQLVADLGLTTVVYDRIGRGASSGVAPIGLHREVVALQALADTLGGPVTLCGHSSGSAIALHAAAAGLLINGLAVWEVPIIGSTEEAHVWAAEFLRLLDAQDHLGAIEHFTRDMPPEFLELLKHSAMWDIMVANAQSLRADAEAIDWFHSAPLSQLLADIKVPVLTMVGESSYDFMHQAADRIVAALPNAKKHTVPGAQHEWQPEPVAALLAEFVLAQS